LIAVLATTWSASRGRSPNVDSMSGRLIVFEGGEASGKSTQAARLAERLGAHLTREPGGTGLGLRLRALLLDETGLHVDERAEALLMAADRAQHISEVIGPALDGGTDVVCDRFVGSSLAYQGYGRSLDLDEVGRLSVFATRGLEADLVILLDLPPDVAAGRIDRPPDRIETAGADFHRRVRDGYLALAKAEPDRWAVVDAARPADEVTRAVGAVVDQRLGGAVP
jgi:dTMP kinase